MKASQLVGELQDLIQDHGDLEVYIERVGAEKAKEVKEVYYVIEEPKEDEPYITKSGHCFLIED